MAVVAVRCWLFCVRMYIFEMQGSVMLLVLCAFFFGYDRRASINNSIVANSVVQDWEHGDSWASLSAVARGFADCRLAVLRENLQSACIHHKRKKSVIRAFDGTT